MSVQVRPRQRLEVRSGTLTHLTKGSAVIFYFLSDFLCILLSFLGAYALRFWGERDWIHPVGIWQQLIQPVDEHFQSHLLVAMAMGVFLIAMLYHNRLYAIERGVRFSHEFVGTLNSVLWTLGFGIIISFLFERFVVSRFVLISFAILLFPTLFSWRLMARRFAERRLAQGYGRAPALIVGAGRVGQQLRAFLGERRWLGLHVVGFLDDRTAVEGPEVLGSLNDFETVVKTKDVHEVFITIPSEKEKILDIVTKAHQMSVSVKVLPELFNLLSREVTFEALGPFTLAKLFRPALSPLQRSMKRLCDVVFAFLLLIFFTPLSIVIILAIKLDGRGPVLFRQTRLGEGGRSFQLMKFRSMHVDVDDAIHREYVTKLIRSAAADRRGQKINKLGNDPRITRVGRIIRRYNLDEIPQLWNVLKGDLSLVGPRPPLPYEYDEYEEYYKKRLLIRPGLTGLWQVSGRYEMDYEQMVMLDIRYINEWSLGLDFKIILETIPQILRPTGS